MGQLSTDQFEQAAEDNPASRQAAPWMTSGGSNEPLQYRTLQRSRRAGIAERASPTWSITAALTPPIDPLRTVPRMAGRVLRSHAQCFNTTIGLYCDAVYAPAVGRIVEGVIQEKLRQPLATQVVARWEGGSDGGRPLGGAGGPAPGASRPGGTHARDGTAWHDQPAGGADDVAGEYPPTSSGASSTRRSAIRTSRRS